MKSTIFYIILIGLVCFLLEIIARIGGVLLGLPFWNPKNIYVKKYYPEVQIIADSIKTAKPNDIKVLILGGSVISTLWSSSDKHLDRLLTPYYPTKNLRFYNAAVPGHTSYDNLVKYKLLKDHTFDLIIYYEAINENRANNIQPAHYHSDYSHMKWFEELSLLQRHPEINYTIVPYIFDRAITAIINNVQGKEYIDETYVPKEFNKYASEIRTATTYKRNIEELVAEAKAKKVKIMLMTYASFFPNVKLENNEEIYKHFAGCKFASAMDLWGDPYNVKKGIAVHNQQLIQVAKENNLTYFDMANAMPHNRLYFCDICHLSEAGAIFFCEKIKEEILRRKYLE